MSTLLHPEKKETVLDEIDRATRALDLAAIALRASEYEQDALHVYKLLVQAEGHVERAQRITDDMGPA
jgi:hypothetical protein